MAQMVQLDQRLLFSLEGKVNYYWLLGVTEDLKTQADVVDVFPPAFIISRPTNTALLRRLLVCNVCLLESVTSVVKYVC